jgi:DNA replication protein DnaC
MEMARRLGAAFRDNRLPHAMKMLTQPRLLSVDEVGYLRLDQAGAAMLFQVICNRYNKTRLPLSLPISHLPNASEMLTNGSKRTALLIYYLLTTAYDALRSGDSTAEPERRRNSLQTAASRPSKSERPVSSLVCISDFL